MSRFEQRANVEFCFKLGETAAETLECLSAVYGDKQYGKQPFTIGLNVSKTAKSHLMTKSGVGPTVNSEKTTKQSKKFKIWFDQIAVYAFKIWQIYVFAFPQQFSRV